MILSQDIKKFLLSMDNIPYQKLSKDKMDDILNSHLSLAEIYDREMKESSENGTINNFIVIYNLMKLFIEHNSPDVSIGVIRVNRYYSKFVLFYGKLLYDPDLHFLKHIGFLGCCRISDTDTYINTWYNVRSYLLKFSRITDVTVAAKKYFSVMEVL